MSTTSQVLHGCKAKFSLLLVPLSLALAACICACLCTMPASAESGKTFIAPIAITDGTGSQVLRAATSTIGGAPDRPAFVPDEIIFKLRVSGKDLPAKAQQALARVSAKHSLKHTEKLFAGNARGPLQNIFRAKLPKGLSPADAAERMKSDLDVEWAEPNGYMYTCAIPNDPSYPQQWHLPKISAPLAWDTTTGSDSVVVAIVDTGVQWDHPDLEGNIWQNLDERTGDWNNDGRPGIAGVDDDGDGKIDEDSAGRQPGETGYTNDLKDDDDENGYVDDIHGWDFVSVDPSQVAPGEDPGPRDNNPSDFLGHGTHCAGIAGAVGNNSLGVAGANWTVRLMAVRAGYKLPNGLGALLNTDIADAITYATQNGADIISMSFGGPDSSLAQAALQNAYSRGVTLIAAAGNSTVDQRFYPAALPYVLAVAATDSADNAAWFTNYGSWVDLAAPGDSIYSTFPGNQYATLSGTSMACPVVAGVAALCLARTPGLTNAQVYQVLKSTCDPLNAFDFIGVGRVNAARALSKTSAATAILCEELKDVKYPSQPVAVRGTASSSYVLYYGQGSYPTSWIQIASGGPVNDDLLGTFDAAAIMVPSYYSLRLVVDPGLSTQSEDRVGIWIDPTIMRGWPQKLVMDPYDTHMEPSAIAADLNGDGVKELSVVATRGYAGLYWADGNSPSGWAKYLYSPLSYANSGSPCIADIDGGGDLEIVVPLAAGSNRLGELTVWKYDGSDAAGWYRTLDGGVGSTSGVEMTVGAVVGDIDGDQDPEILCPCYNYNSAQACLVNAWHHDGTEVSGWPKFLPSTDWIFSNLALADFDGNGCLDVVIPYTGPSGPTVSVVDSSGQELPGWPALLEGAGTVTGCSVGDLEGDGAYEVIILSSSGHRIYALDHQGNPPAGWSAPVEPFVPTSSPALGDVNNDGRLEIAYQTICGTACLRDSNGILMPGWPVGASPICWISTKARPSVCIADVNGDRRSDIVVADYAVSRLYAYDILGSVLPGFPRAVGNGGNVVISATPDISDLDGDGSVDISLAANDGQVYLWDTGAPVNPYGDEWPRLGNQLTRNFRYDRRPVIIRVSQTGDDSNDGCTWAAAKRTIQAAVNVSPLGAEIWVAQGTYNEYVDLSLPVKLYGGFAGSEATREDRDWLNHPTIIDSQDAGTAITATGVPHPLIIDGFIIRSTPNGTGSGIRCLNSELQLTNDRLSHNHASTGGALYASESSVTMADCIVEYNSANSGGAVYLDGGSATFTACTFSGNSAQADGGAIYSTGCEMMTTDCAFTGNTCQGIGGAVYGGALCSGSVTGCTFSGNSAGISGGGLCVCSDAFSVAASTFTDNTAGTYGGAILCGTASMPIVQNCIMRGNSAANGAGIACVDASIPEISYNTITANTASLSGGGIYGDESSYPIVGNCIVAFNSSGIHGAPGCMYLMHNDVFGNATYQYGPGLLPGDGDISADPQFANRLAGDLHIRSGSPCRDAGDGYGLSTLETDIDGQNRVQGSAVDIGADESYGETHPAVILRVKADSEHDGPGNDWDHAWHTVAKALNYATSGDQVWVSAGEYTESVVMKNGVALYGGYSGTGDTRDPAQYETILDGDGASTVVTIVSCPSASTAVDGFTIHNGLGNSGDGTNSGGGIYCEDSSPTISHNKITENTATYGAGIYCDLSADDMTPVITDNEISGNQAPADVGVGGNGGAIYCTGGGPSIASNEILNNSADDGGALYLVGADAHVQLNHFSGDSAWGSVDSTGGAIYCTSPGHNPLITHNVFESCSAEIAGAVACIVSPAVVANNALFGNAGIECAGIYCSACSPCVANNTLRGNDSMGSGGSISCVNNSSAAISNNILSWNTSGISADAGSAPALRNNCLWQNNQSDYIGLVPGTGDMMLDPLFADPYSGYVLSVGSPCINTGWNDAPGIQTVDIDAQPRINNVIVDMGADEFYP